MPQPVDPRILGVTVAGGAIGVLARGLVLDPVADPTAVPWVTLGINVVGSLILGVVVGWLDDRRPVLRSFLGTGIMGGFTTYSAFAVATALWVATPWLAAGLAAASVIAGVGGAVVGLFIGRRIADRPGEIEYPEDAE
ncbi:CrcB family protein [Microbacterium trichothecenolyticum]|uniref:Fluoride-specific ion channel FluC n=1 Tax=Microbacterium ureisolvens TaxID=2781186 RepID=A0ABS7HYV1_9MICO|nr:MULTISPECIES: CrcB family protein [Microbacterium]MBW9109727.1 CrcB family protein [Microbacterium ureisolvens]MBW9120345.1 CrcB family protein [Microbacterium trichothecenolyticum]